MTLLNLKSQEYVYLIILWPPPLYFLQIMGKFSSPLWARSIYEQRSPACPSLPYVFHSGVSFSVINMDQLNISDKCGQGRPVSPFLRYILLILDLLRMAWFTYFPRNRIIFPRFTRHFRQDPDTLSHSDIHNQGLGSQLNLKMIVIQSRPAGRPIVSKFSGFFFFSASWTSRYRILSRKEQIVENLIFT